MEILMDDVHQDFFFYAHRRRKEICTGKPKVASIQSR